MKGQMRAWRKWQDGRQREVVLWALQNELADKRGTLPHEERFWADAALRDFEADHDRAANRPLLAALVASVVGSDAVQTSAANSVGAKALAALP